MNEQTSAPGLGLLSIADIVADHQKKFFVPNYQRGYRWGDTQVRELLEDLTKFYGEEAESWYCLQPLVTFRRSEDGADEVVDGQQRLTTLALILAEAKSKVTLPMEFARHEKTLEELVKEGRKCPDSHFIGKALEQIQAYPHKEWFEHLANKDHPKQVRFISYELDPPDAIDAFIRLNAGKIRLTDVELLRALLLRSSSVLDDSERLGIAAAWDRMEKRLNEPEFWCFAAPEDFTPENRIELVFRMATGIAPRNNDSGRELYEHLAPRFAGDEIRRMWEEIETAFAALDEWYEDHAVYHLIGFLSSLSGKGNPAVMDLYRRHWLTAPNGTKKSFREILKGRIALSLFGKDYAGRLGKESIAFHVGDLDYEENPDGIRPLLLCFNLATLMKERQGMVRFSFHAFRDQKWDIEHIRARATEATGKELEDALRDHHEYLRKHGSGKFPELEAALKQALARDSGGAGEAEARKSLYERCVAELGDGAADRENLNLISNLTLLDEKTNRGYKNNPFRIKRAWIHGTENQHIYIPPCTRNVFAKSYTPEAEDLVKWDLAVDGAAYCKEIIEVLHGFFADAACSLDPAASPDRQADTQVAASARQGQCQPKQAVASATPLPSKGTLNFLDLVRECGRIEIPLIQRDYVQGRSSAATVRKEFLAAIFRALRADGPLTLDFVYGTSGEGARPAFHPIDGQQRLTTLFLLHWYAAVKAGKVEEFRERFAAKDGISRFSYRVRPGAERFFPALLKWNPRAEAMQGNWFQKHLPEQIWFSRGWLDDPTVKGALVMLDAIAAHFAAVGNLDDWEERLGKITMEVLFLPDDTTGDELYLKMNARGKELTGFEKFKAWLVDHYEKMSGDYVPAGGGSSTWKLRLDQEWLDFFWKPSATAKDCSARVSACYFNSFIALAINHRAKEGCSKAELEKWLKLGDGYQPEEWAELLDRDTIEAVFKIMDSFSGVPVDDLWKGERDWFDASHLVTANPEAKLSLPDRCWLHAISLFCKRQGGEDQKWWLRVVRNLIWSADRRSDAFRDVISSIERFGERLMGGGLVGLAGLQVEKAVWPPQSFAEQLEEECLKARLRVEAPDDWAMIREAEDHNFLNGQVEVLLRDIERGSDPVDARTFSNRWKIFAVMMDAAAMKGFVPDSDEALDRLVIRAVLSQCADHELSTEGIQLPWIAVDRAWGDALKRSNLIIRGRLQNALLVVLDGLAARNAFKPAEMVACLEAFIQAPKPTTAWMQNVILHGEALLQESRDWKLKCYHRHWSHGEMAGFLYKGANRSDDGDILIGSEFNLRNELIATLVKSGWGLAGDGHIDGLERAIYRGHHRELTREGKKLRIRYQTVVEVSDQGVELAPRGLEEWIRSLKEEAPSPAPVPVVAV